MIDNKKEFLQQINSKSIVSIIPARGGSKGVPKKNIRKLSGYPLIAYSIAASRMSSKIQRTIVSTDSEEIAEVAKFFGAEVPFIRPKKFAADLSGDIEFVEHAIKYFFEYEREIPEYLVHLRPTTPLRNVNILDEAIDEFIFNKESTSLRSAHEAPESPYKWFLRSDTGYFRSIKENVSNETANNGRQQFETVYIPDGYIDILNTKYVIEEGILHGTKMQGYISPTCIEVDTEQEFELLEYYIKKNQTEVYEYLLKEFPNY